MVDKAKGLSITAPSYHRQRLMKTSILNHYTSFFRNTILKNMRLKFLISSLSASLALTSINVSWAKETSNIPELKIHGLIWDAHEMTIGEVKRFAQKTGFISQAEKDGYGFTYDLGWSKKTGWNWKQPYGIPAHDQEPAVQLNFDEAQQICQFFGKRLPKDQEWTAAAYLEQRANPPSGYEKGKRYPYPHGQSAKTSHCLGDCSNLKGVAPANILDRGTGHVRVMTTTPGVNGLYDMGGNAWEWVDDTQGNSVNERITRGSSWWYGASRQLEADVATKPKDTRVVYVGFRCVR
jgi:formylglycine-generating enzyme required for sulfatase activity